MMAEPDLPNNPAIPPNKLMTREDVQIHEQPSHMGSCGRELGIMGTLDMKLRNVQIMTSRPGDPNNFFDLEEMTSPGDPNIVTDTQQIMIAPQEQVSNIRGDDIINQASEAANDDGVAGKGLTLSHSLSQSQSQAPTAACSAHQHSSNTIHSVNSTGHIDPEKLSFVGKQLIVLYHAHECARRVNNVENNQSKCNFNHCKTMQEILVHITNCKMNNDCTVRYCSLSRQIITHWKNCERQHCPICLPLRSVGRYRSNTSIAAGHTVSSHADNSIHLDSKQQPQQDITNSDKFVHTNNLLMQQRTGSNQIPNGQHQQLHLNLQKQPQQCQQNREALPQTFTSPQQESPHRGSIKVFGSNVGELQKPSQVEIAHFTRSKKLETSVLLGLMEPRRRRNQSNEQQHNQPLSQNKYHQHHETTRSRMVDVSQYQQVIEIPQRNNSSANNERILTQNYNIENATIAGRSEILSPIPVSTRNYPNVSPLHQSPFDPTALTRPIQSMPFVDSLTIDWDRNKATNINEEINAEPISDGIKSEMEPVTKPNQPNKSDKTKRLFKPEELRQALMPTFEKMYQQNPEALPFMEPVDALFIPSYYEIIRKPMDFSTIKNKLNSGQYSDPWEYVDDVWLMFDNAKTFNRTTTRVYRYCTTLSEIFEKEIDPVMKTLGYCCGKNYIFRPKKLYCYGKRLCVIPRNAKYFNYESYNICQKCFLNILGDTITLNDKESQCQTFSQIHKNKFMELKNDLVESEPFVVCLDCGRKQHKICVLYLEHIWPDGYMCENCMRIKNTKKKENKFNAKRLPVTKLSVHIEKRVNNFLKQKEANIGEVHVRVVSSFDKMVEVKSEMRNRFVKSGELDSEFSYRGKALFAFKEFDGVDVCFFGMHVQEYGTDCANPNKRRVYISYLDSVHFFQPRQYRTDVYHEILLGYIDYVKQLGYTVVHIWACPPPEGDDYVFHCHPIDQRMPNPTRLQVWYTKMLEKGKNEQIILDYEDLFEYSMKNKLNSAVQLPYFEGDFWPNFLEESIKVLDRNQAKKRKLAEAAITSSIDDENNMRNQFKKKRRKKSKKSYISKASERKNNKTCSLQQTGNDLSDRILNIMEIHKESFFVIRLHSAQSASTLGPIQDPDPLIPCDLMDGPDAFLVLARDRNFEFSSLRRAKFSSLCMLYELHNQENNFAFTCDNCKNQMKARYHCRVCNDYDLCIGCKEIIGHVHEMDKLDYSSSPSDLQKTNPQDATKQVIHRHIKTLVHAFECSDSNCQTLSCQKMQQVVNHMNSCNKKTDRSCPTCKQIIALCCYHTKFCQDPMCPVPFCINLKTKLKQQQMQQRLQQAQLMSRRMAVMNTDIMSTDSMNAGIGSMSPYSDFSHIGTAYPQQQPSLVMEDKGKINSKCLYPNNHNSTQYSEMGVFGGPYINQIVSSTTLPGGDMFQLQRADNLESKYPDQINKDKFFN